MKAFPILLCLGLLLAGRGQAQPQYSIMVIHCDPPNPDPQDPCQYPGKVDFQKLGRMVRIADRYGAKLTIQLSPAWVDTILNDLTVYDSVRAWMARGHEIAAHHHHYGHKFWDGYMNDPSYQDSIPPFPNCGTYIGRTEDFYEKLRLVVDDSLLLTCGQGPNNDPDFLEGEWSEGIWYRTNDRTNQPPPFGGRVTEDAFSSVSKDTMGAYVVCALSYCFIDDTSMGYDSLFTMLDKFHDPAYAHWQVIGAVTHPFNFKPQQQDTIFAYWLDTITQLVPVLTVREIMRREGCYGETLLPTAVQPEPETSSLALHPNPVADALELNVPPELRVSALEIWSASGKKWRSYSGLPPQIEVRGLPAGVYFLQVLSPQRQEVLRFLKL